MIYGLLSTFTLALHALWIVWILLGPFFIASKPRLRLAYGLSVAVTFLIAFSIGICPLTDLELYFRARAGSTHYEGGFIHHYLSRFVYLGDRFPTLAGLQISLLALLALAILISFRKLRF